MNQADTSNPDEPTGTSPTTAGPGRKDRTQRRRWRILLLGGVLAVALVTMGITALLINILERRTEGQEVAYTVAKLTEESYDPAEWGKNFPIQYDQWLKTKEMEPTTHGGSRPIEITMPDGKTRIATESRIEHDPRLVTMWTGYPFSVDYREARGHAYMLEDQQLTRRVSEFKQPGTCLNCHASTVPIMKELGNGDLQAGFHAMNKLPYEQASKMAKHPVACIDCHDPKTMALRITRPAFMTGIAEFKKTQGVTDYDVNRDASPQEMRNFVCAQCHTEYYFEGESKTLRFPWAKGLQVDQILADSTTHIDWVYPSTGTKMLKAQHPEFDLAQQGVHAAAGVSCADCHMPYKREGAVKLSDHQIRSPMLMVNNACLSCHSASEKDMTARVKVIQDRFVHSRDVAMDALMDLIKDLEVAQTDGTPKDRIEVARSYHRKASFFIDYLYSENSYGFHAPGESLRVFNDAVDAARRGQMALQGKVTEPAEKDGPDQSGPAPKPIAAAKPAPNAAAPTAAPTQASP